MPQHETSLNESPPPISTAMFSLADALHEFPSIPGVSVIEADRGAFDLDLISIPDSAEFYNSTFFPGEVLSASGSESLSVSNIETHQQGGMPSANNSAVFRDSDPWFLSDLEFTTWLGEDVGDGQPNGCGFFSAGCAVNEEWLNPFGLEPVLPDTRGEFSFPLLVFPSGISLTW